MELVDRTTDLALVRIAIMREGADSDKMVDAINDSARQSAGINRHTVVKSGAPPGITGFEISVRKFNMLANR